MKFLLLSGIYASTAFGFSTEHHLLLCDRSPKVVMEAFGVKGSDSTPSSVIYFDDKERNFFANGIIIRARTSRHSSKVTVDLKLRPLEIKSLPKKWQKHQKIKCEYDAHPAKTVGSCRIKEEMSRKNFNEWTSAGEFSRILTDSQQEFAEDLSQKKIPWQHLSMIGPVRIDSWSASRFSFELEIVSLGSGRFLSEISTRSKDKKYQNGLVDLARKKNLNLCKKQDSKTERILRAFR